MAREFLMLAHVYESVKHKISSWMLSTKMDGMRAFWDAGISRGMLVSDVPWANTAKDARYISQPRSTGLWSRYGKSIQAPDYWIDTLPRIPLDGELWMGNGKFQQVMATVKDLVPGPEWTDIKYKVFDAPSYLQIFSNGEIKLKKRFEKKLFGIMEWIQKRPFHDGFLNQMRPFTETQVKLHQFLPTPRAELHKQIRLPYSENAAKQFLEDYVNQVIADGGEGVMLRNPSSLWAPTRSWSLLKYKPYLDDEGEVVGFTFGRETDLGSKLLGKVGALIVEWRGKRFKLSGFTDEERELRTRLPEEALRILAGMEASWESSQPVHFPKGCKISFKYRELTDEGIPKEARYLRKRDDE